MTKDTQFPNTPEGLLAKKLRFAREYENTLTHNQYDEAIATQAARVYAHQRRQIDKLVAEIPDPD